MGKGFNWRTMRWHSHLLVGHYSIGLRVQSIITPSTMTGRKATLEFTCEIANVVYEVKKSRSEKRKKLGRLEREGRKCT